MWNKFLIFDKDFRKAKLVVKYTIALGIFDNSTLHGENMREVTLRINNCISGIGNPLTLEALQSEKENLFKILSYMNMS